MKDLLGYFNDYKQAMFAIENDINFIRTVLSQYADNVRKQFPDNYKLAGRIFCSYNIPINSWGYLQSHPKAKEISTEDIQQNFENFINWVQLLCLVKAYNACENFIYQSIRHCYFSEVKESNIKKLTSLINKKIKSVLTENQLQYETENNKHLIDYLEFISTDIKSFLYKQINIDNEYSWKTFFKTISILRNNIAHSGDLIHRDTWNTLNSIYPKIKVYFYKDSERLKSKIDVFTNFTDQYNVFTLNLIKFMCKEDNLNFLGMT